MIVSFYQNLLGFLKTLHSLWKSKSSECPGFLLGRLINWASQQLFPQENQMWAGANLAQGGYLHQNMMGICPVLQLTPAFYFLLSSPDFSNCPICTDQNFSLCWFQKFLICVFPSPTLFFFFCLFGKEWGKATSRLSMWVRSDPFSCRVLKGRAWLRVDMISRTCWQINKGILLVALTITTKIFCSHIALWP